MGYHNGEAVRLSDVADVVDSTQNVRTAGYLDGHQADRGPSSSASRGANIIETVERIRAALPFLEAALPQGIHSTIVLDRTTTIRPPSMTLR